MADESPSAEQQPPAVSHDGSIAGVVAFFRDTNMPKLGRGATSTEGKRNAANTLATLQNTQDRMDKLNIKSRIDKPVEDRQGLS